MPKRKLGLAATQGLLLPCIRKSAAHGIEVAFSAVKVAVAYPVVQPIELLPPGHGRHLGCALQVLEVRLGHIGAVLVVAFVGHIAKQPCGERHVVPLLLDDAHVEARNHTACFLFGQSHGRPVGDHGLIPTAHGIVGIRDAKRSIGPQISSVRGSKHPAPCDLRAVPGAETAPRLSLACQDDVADFGHRHFELL